MYTWTRNSNNTLTANGQPDDITITICDETFWDSVRTTLEPKGLADAIPANTFATIEYPYAKYGVKFPDEHAHTRIDTENDTVTVNHSFDSTESAEYWAETTVIQLLDPEAK